VKEKVTGVAGEYGDSFRPMMLKCVKEELSRENEDGLIYVYEVGGKKTGEKLPEHEIKKEVPL